MNNDYTQFITARLSIAETHTSQNPAAVQNGLRVLMNSTRRPEKHVACLNREAQTDRQYLHHDEQMPSHRRLTPGSLHF